MVCSTPMSFRFFPLFVSETEMGEVWENWFLTKTISLSPDVSEAHGGALSVHVTSGATTCDCHERTFCHVGISSTGP